MTTEQEPTRPAKRDNQIANTCGIAAVALVPCFAFYFLLVSNGVLNPPPGLTGMWTITIIGLGFVKVNTWIVDRRVSVMEHRHAAELTEVRDELRALRRAILPDEDQVATEMLTSAEKYLNERGTGTVAHLSRVRPGL